MGIYTKSPQQTVLDLIISENPGFTGVTTADVTVGTPTVISGALTSIKIRGKDASNWTGVVVVQYNRINIATLFLNQTTIAITQYNATKLSDLLPRLNYLYGLNLTAADLQSDPVVSGTSQTVTMTLTPSPMYYGNISVAWTKGTTPQIWELYPNRSLTNLYVPTLMLKAYQADFTGDASTLTAHNPAVAFSSGSSTAVAIVAAIARLTGLAATLGPTTTPGSGTYDLSGFTLALKTADQLTDSNPQYRRVAVLTPPAQPGMQNVVMYLHYDKIVPAAIATSSIITTTSLAGLDLPT